MSSGKLCALLESQRRNPEFQVERLQVLNGQIAVNPTMVKLAREFRGMTPSMLARKIKTTTAQARRIEAGECPAEATRIVQAIADATGMLVTFFAQTDEIIPVRFICSIDPMDGSTNHSRHAPKVTKEEFRQVPIGDRIAKIMRELGESDRKQ